MTLPLNRGVWVLGQRHPEHVVGYLVGYFLEINHGRSEYLLEEYVRGHLVHPVLRNEFLAS